MRLGSTQQCVVDHHHWRKQWKRQRSGQLFGGGQRKSLQPHRDSDGQWADDQDHSGGSMRSILFLLVGVAPLAIPGIPEDAGATVLCRVKSSGAVVAREEACKRKETQL